MPKRTPPSLTPERSAAILEEALRRIDLSISAPVDLDALRLALETEQAKGPRSLVGLMKVGRRRALDRLGRAARKRTNQLAAIHETPPHSARCRREQ